MRPDKMFRLILTSLFTLMLLVGCQSNDSQRPKVTGKGNGGNGLAMSEEEVSSKLENLKPHLKKLFSSLENLNRAELLISGSTDLEKFPELQGLLTKMFDGPLNVFVDIQTENNIEPTNDPCLDFRGYENVAAAKAMDHGGKVCFSISELRKISPKGAETISDIQLLSVAAHEFGHHYLESRTPEESEEDEKLLRTLQAFVNYQLQKFDEMYEEGVVAETDTPYLDRFYDFSLETLEQVKSSTSTKTDEEI